MGESRSGHSSDVVIRFAGFEFDRDRRALSRADRAIRAEPKVLALIEFLLERHGRIASNDEILAAVWPDVSTTPGSVSRAVSLARAALAHGDGEDPREIIETVRGKGYRIAVPVAYVEPARGHEPPGSFVGRAAIVETLTAALEDLVGGKGGLTLVAGEAGIGKTRLAEEIADRAQHMGVEVMWGRSREDGGGPAYVPWTEILHTHVRRRGIERVRDDAGPDCEALADLLPALEAGREMPGDASSSAVGRALQHAAFERLLTRVSESQALLLILEDVHVADEASHLLLRRLAQTTKRSRIGFLITYRGDELVSSAAGAETLIELARCVPDRIEVSLEGLTRNETFEFVRERASSPWSDEDVTRLHERSDGSPFFLQELIRHQAEGDRSPLPETLRLLMRSRIDGLDENLASVLRMAAVFGREFRTIDLAHALGKNEAEVSAWLGDAEALRLVEATKEGTNEFRFTHALVREALYDLLRTDERRRLHGRVGNTLAALYGKMDRPPFDDLARHCEEAGFADRAIRYSIAAAERSRRHLAFELAATSLQRALRVLSLTPPVDQEQECNLLLDLGDVLHRSGKVQAGAAAIQRAIDIARHVRAVGAFAQGVCTMALWRDDNIGIVPTERLSLLEEALDMLPTDDSPLRARLLTALSIDLYWSDDFERSSALSREAIEVAQRVGDPATTFIALYQRFDLLFGPEYGEEVDRINAEALSLAKQLRDLEYEFLARGRLWERHLAKAEPAEVDRGLAECTKIAERLRQPRFWLTVERMRATRELVRGDLAAAKARLPEPHAADLGSGSAISSIAMIPHMFLVLRMEGRLEQLEPIARAGVEQFPHLYALRCALALFCALTERTDEAKSLLAVLARNDFALLRRDVNHSINLAVLAETVARVGDRELARALVPMIEPYAGCHMVTGAFMSLGSADRYLGLLATTLGRFEAAARHFDQALEIETRMSAAPWIAWAERDYARMLTTRDGGKPNAEARKRLEHAARIERQILGGPP